MKIFLQILLKTCINKLGFNIEQQRLCQQREHSILINNFPSPKTPALQNSADIKLKNQQETFDFI
jgi:hypothetical protein